MDFRVEDQLEPQILPLLAYQLIKVRSVDDITSNETVIRKWRDVKNQVSECWGMLNSGKLENEKNLCLGLHLCIFMHIYVYIHIHVLIPSSIPICVSLSHPYPYLYPFPFLYLYVHGYTDTQTYIP